MTASENNGIAQDLSGGVHTIVLDRPIKKNALTSAMYGALAKLLNEGNSDPNIRVHLLLGNGDCFTAGNDLTDFQAAAQGGEFDANAMAFLKALTANKKPLVAAVDGPAIGVGTTLLLHCDLVYASPRASFQTPFIDLGLVPEAASSFLMPARMGHQRAFEMICMGAVFDADQALAAGLVNAILPTGELEFKAREAARVLSRKPQAALRAARQLMRRDAAALDGIIDEEIEQFKTCLRSPEAREAIKAFLEKRPPDFERARAQAGE